jgi:hypothetical protein
MGEINITLLKQKTELVIQGLELTIKSLEAADDYESNKKFSLILNEFTEQLIKLCESEIAKENTLLN